MRSFSIMIIFAIVCITFLYVVMTFFEKKNNEFSSNVKGNISGRDGVAQSLSPIGIVSGIVGIK